MFEKVDDNQRPLPPEACACEAGARPAFVCTACRAVSCRLCARAVGTSGVRLCKSCGYFCAEYDNHARRLEAEADRREPFGRPDFVSALLYPLRQPSTLLGLGVVYGALLYGVPYFMFNDFGLLFGVVGLAPLAIATLLLIGSALQVVEDVGRGGDPSGRAVDTSAMLADIGDLGALCLGIAVPTTGPLVLTLLAAPGGMWWPSVLCGVWAAFYYPLALLVAAVTSDVWAAMNPLQGYGAAKTMGRMFPRFSVLYWPLAVGAAAALALAVGGVFSVTGGVAVGAALPVFVVAGVISGPVIFYVNMATAHLLGRAWMKAVDVSDAP